MSISITINNINDLTDAERAVLRLIAADPCEVHCMPPIPDDELLTIPDFLRTATVAPLGEESYQVPVAAPSVLVGQPVTNPAAWTPVGSAELDARGLPWDKRIHASTKTQTQDGLWKYARGVDKLLVPQVEAELLAVQAIPVPEVAAVTAPAPIVPLSPVPAALPMTFTQLMQHTTPMLVSGELNQPILQSVVEKLGLPHLAALGARPDLVETVRAAIDEVCNGAV
jgi:hypothetical protein